MLNGLCSLSIGNLFNISVDERSERIHNKNSERHTFGICTPQTDDDCEHTDTYTVNQHTFMIHRRCHIVGSHEACTQKQTTRKQMIHRRCICCRICQVHDTTKHEYGKQNRYRNVPSDNLLPQHIYQTDNQRQLADFTDTAGTNAFDTITQ